MKHKVNSFRAVNALDLRCAVPPRIGIGVETSDERDLEGLDGPPFVRPAVYPRLLVLVDVNTRDRYDRLAGVDPALFLLRDRSFGRDLVAPCPPGNHRLTVFLGIRNKLRLDDGHGVGVGVVVVDINIDINININIDIDIAPR